MATLDPGNRRLRTQERYRVLAHVRATQPNCWICGYPVNVALPPRTQLSSTVDEIIPRSLGGSATDLDNVRHAHLCCNGSKGNRPLTDEVRARCRRRIEELTAEPIRHLDVGVDWYNP